jgi:hypothetical protein
MKRFRKVLVFPSGSWHRSPELSVGERPTERGDAPNDPQHQQCKYGFDAENLESEACENPDTDHAGNHQGYSRLKTNGIRRWPGGVPGTRFLGGT